jgi:hypothetical protein
MSVTSSWRTVAASSRATGRSGPRSRFGSIAAYRLVHAPLEIARSRQPDHLGVERPALRPQPTRRRDDDESSDEIRSVDRQLERHRTTRARARQEHGLADVVLDRVRKVPGDVRHRLAEPKPSLAIHRVDRECTASGASDDASIRRSKPLGTSC